MSHRRTAGLFEALEPRTMLAQTTVFTDVDGDQYTVKLTGPGSFSVNTDANGIDLLAVTGTDASSALSISVKKVGAGDGRVAMRTMTADRLKSLLAPKVDVKGNNAQVDAGLINTVVIGNVLGSMANDLDFNILGGTDTDRVRFTCENMNFTDLAIQARVSEFKAGQVLFIELQFTRGADKITVSADFAGTITIPGAGAFANAIGTLKTGFLSLDGTLSNGIGTIDARNIGEGSITVAGPIGTLRSRGDSMGLSVDAAHIRTLDARFANIVDVDIVLSAPDASGFALRSFRADAIDNMQIFPNKGGIPGIVGSMRFRTGDDIFVAASAIDSFRATEDATELEVNINDVPAGRRALGSMVVGGLLHGEITFKGPIGSIRALGTGPSNTLELSGHGSPESTVGSVIFTGTATSNVDFSIATIGTLKSNGLLNGDMELNSKDAKNISAKLLEAPVFNVNVNLTATSNTDLGGISSIRAQLIDDTVIAARFISSLVLRPGAAADGRLRNATIRTNGFDNDGLGIRSASINGAIDGAGLQARFSLGTISVGRLIDAVVQAGNFNVQPFVISDLGTQTAGATIRRLNVNSAFDAANPAWLNSFVNAPVISFMQVRGFVEVANMGGAHGIGTGGIDTLLLRSATNQPLAPAPSLTLGNNTVFGPGTDFIVRLLA